MTEQLAFLDVSVPTTPAVKPALRVERLDNRPPLKRLVELPIPLPRLGFDCQICAAKWWVNEDGSPKELELTDAGIAGFPAYNPRAQRMHPAVSRLDRVVCFEHLYGGRPVAEGGWPPGLVKLEWQRNDQGVGGWREVVMFSPEEAADARYRWPGWRGRVQLAAAESD